MANQMLQVLYFVDTENISDRWIQLLPLPQTAGILLFYTQNSKDVSYPVLEQLMNNPCNIKTIPCVPGANALDFQLVTELGMQIAQKPKIKFVICSNDHGFDAVVKYWTDKKYNVVRQDFPANTKSVTKQVQVRKNTDPAQQVRPVVQKNFPENCSQYIEPTVQILVKQGHSNLQKIYQAFIKKYGQKQGLQIYKTVKTPIKKICTALSDNK